MKPFHLLRIALLLSLLFVCDLKGRADSCKALLDAGKATMLRVNEEFVYLSTFAYREELDIDSLSSYSEGKAEFELPFQIPNTPFFSLIPIKASGTNDFVRMNFKSMRSATDETSFKKSFNGVYNEFLPENVVEAWKYCVGINSDAPSLKVDLVDAFGDSIVGTCEVFNPYDFFELKEMQIAVIAEPGMIEPIVVNSTTNILTVRANRPAIFELKRTERGKSKSVKVAFKPLRAGLAPNIITLPDPTASFEFFTGTVRLAAINEKRFSEAPGRHYVPDRMKKFKYSVTGSIVDDSFVLKLVCELKQDGNDGQEFVARIDHTTTALTAPTGVKIWFPQKRSAISFNDELSIREGEANNDVTNNELVKSTVLRVYDQVHSRSFSVGFNQEIPIEGIMPKNFDTNSFPQGFSLKTRRSISILK